MMLLSMGVWGQNQWYFGNGAGLDFTNRDANGFPTAIRNNVFRTGEGCAMAYDQNNILLFYTDGTRIYRANHSTVDLGLNADGTTRLLTGSSSTTQSAVIVPIPGSECRNFVVFTLGSYETYDNLINTPVTQRRYNFNYTIVNVDNQGNITVDPQNINREINFIPFDSNLRLFTEKLTAIQRPDGNYWVMIHDYKHNSFNDSANPTSNLGYSFYAIEVNQNFIANPNQRIIHTPIGKEVTQSNRFDTTNETVGQMKFSRDGRRIAITKDNRIQLFSFDMGSGVVSDLRTISVNNRQNTTINTSYFYGLEFSPSGRYLYTTAVWSRGNNNGIYRILINNFLNNTQPISQTIINTPTNTPNNNWNFDFPFAALEINPIDGRMYCASAEMQNPTQYVGALSNIDDANSNILPTYNIVTLLDSTSSQAGLPTTVIGLLGCGTPQNTCECNEGFTNIIVQDNIIATRKGKRYDYKCGNKHDQNINEIFYLRPILSCNGTPTGTTSRITYSIKNETGNVIVEDRVLQQPTTSNGAIEVLGFNNFIKLSKDLFPNCGLYTITFKGSCCNDVCNGCELKINVIGCEPPKECITCCLPTSLKDINDNKLFLNQFRNPSLDYQPSTNFKTLINNYLSTIQIEANENNCQLKEGDVEIKLNFYKYNGNSNPNDINRTLMRTDFRAFQNAQNNNFQLISTHSATTNTNFENLLTLNGWYIVELSIKVKNKPDCSTSLIVVKDNNLGKRNTSTNSNKN